MDLAGCCGVSLAHKNPENPTYRGSAEDKSLGVKRSRSDTYGPDNVDYGRNLGGIHDMQRERKPEKYQ